MEIYEFDQDVSSSNGRPTKHIRDIIDQEEQWFRDNFVSHGSVVGHCYDEKGLLHNQARKTGDINVGRGKGRHINVGLMRGLSFCKSVYNHWDRITKGGKCNIPNGFTLEELYRGLVYVYDKSEFINALYKTGLSEYMHLAKDSKTVDVSQYKNPSEFLGEYYIYDRTHIDLIDPKFLIIGAIPRALKKRDRKKIKNILPLIKPKYPNTEVIYFPNMPIGIGKVKGSTGNGTHSLIGLKVLNAIKKVLSGTYHKNKYSI